jgi:hypothetical protein
MANTNHELSSMQIKELLKTLKERFEKNRKRHPTLEWDQVAVKLEANTDKIWSLYEMERTGGEPDVVGYDKETYTFVDCSEESPIGRRNLCYDPDALHERKANKPPGSAMGMAAEMGIELLTEAQYRQLQQFEAFDLKTSSWIKTPSDIRKLGGALFADRRYGNVFVYHNGAISYYAARGFRALLKV